MPEPPKLAERLLIWMLGRDGEVVAGDLAESYEERGGGLVWYWSQVLSCLLVRLAPHHRMIPGLRQDLHHALRTIRRNPGYALASMVCLALGIGVNTTVFSVLDGMLFRRLPVPEADRVITLDRNGAPPCSFREYLDLKSTLGTLAGVVAVIPRETYLDVGQANDQIYIETVTANYAEVLRTKPKMGRWFVPADENSGGGFPVVISDRIWERHFHRDSNVLGQPVRIENKLYQIIGVAGAEFQGVSSPLAVDAWVPLASFPLNRAQFDSVTDISGPDVFVIGRLAPGANLKTAKAEMAVIDARLRSASPQDPRLRVPLSVNAVSGYISQQARRRVAPLAALLAAVVGIVLLVACVNVANLLLSRAIVRQREMAVRLSLGATRGRLVQMGLTEGLVLAAGGALLGLVIGFWTNQTLSAWLPASLPQTALRMVFFEINWRVAGLTALVSLLCAILFSLAPALESARTDFTPALKGQEGGMSALQTGRRRDVYAAAQVALSLVLLVSAGLLLRAMSKVASIDPGFATERRMYVRLFTPQPDFTPETSTQLFSRLVDEARALPGVQDATLSFTILGFNDRDCASLSPTEAPRKLGINVVEPNYFQMMRVPIVRGRNFSSADRPGTRRAVIVNETMRSVGGRIRMLSAKDYGSAAIRRMAAPKRK